MTQLEIELGQLKKEVGNMWQLVQSQLINAKEAMVLFDKDLARDVVSKEKRVNAYELKIDRDCEDIFALYTPVAIDLRFLLAVLKINSNLERIGDIAEGIAKYVINTSTPFNKKVFEDTQLFQMYYDSIEILNDSRIAFENEDTHLARTIFKRDEALDLINSAAISSTMQLIKENFDSTEEALYTLSIIRKLERVGDQCKNIAEEIIFYVEAKVLKHSSKKHLEQ